MALPPGTRLGVYEVTAQIGAGGMGEVYRARDTKLNRDVAIKVLLLAFANDPDRLARFSREAQVLASLNHPNIAAIYGIEDGGDVLALVMELVEGETLGLRDGLKTVPWATPIPGRRPPHAHVRLKIGCLGAGTIRTPWLLLRDRPAALRAPGHFERPTPLGRDHH